MFLSRREPTFGGTVGRVPPLARGGSAGGSGPSGVLPPPGLHDGTGPPSADRAGPPGKSAGEVVAGCGRGGFRTDSLPPVPEESVEFDPTLGRLLAPWLAGAGRLYRRVVGRWRRRGPTLRDLDLEGGGVTGGLQPVWRSPGWLPKLGPDRRRRPDHRRTAGPGPEGAAPRVGNWLARPVRPAVGGLRDLGGGAARGLGQQVTPAPCWLVGAAVAIGSGEVGRCSSRGSRLSICVLARPRQRPGRPVAGDIGARRRLSRLSDAPRLGRCARVRPGLRAGRAVGDPRWALAGFAIAGGWGFLGLHNDCRYKAFFQRLKEATATYRVEGGSGGRTSPPTPWPRRGRCALTWPAYKACEPHVVLIGLSSIAAAGDRCPRRVARRLAWWRSGHGGGRAGAGDRSGRPRGPPRRGRGRVRPMVPADRERPPRLNLRTGPAKMLDVRRPSGTPSPRRRSRRWKGDSSARPTCR